ncbi:complex I subunit 4 family protein [Methylomagnum sp.]
MPTEIAWSAQAPLPVLSLLAFWPLLVMVAVLLSGSRRQAFFIGFGGTGLELGIALFVVTALDRQTAQLQFAEHLRLLPFLSYHLAVDGLSVLFIAATALLSFLMVLYGRIVMEEPLRHYLAGVLVFEAMLISLFMAQDLLQFWLLAATEVLPATYLSLRWGTGQARQQATVRYLQFMGGGLGMLLCGPLVLGWHHAQVAGYWSFDLADLLTTPLPPHLETVVFVFMYYGFSVRMAMFPFHGWLPPLAQHGTLATVGVFLVGSRLGIYGLLRFVLPLLPDAVHVFKPLAVGLGLVGIFYGALLALMQLNLRRLLAFAAVSQSGMLVIGVFCLNREGLAGALLLAVNFGVASSALLFATGLLLHRAGSSLLPRLGGLFDPMPLLGITFLIGALSTMAMPGTPGFDAAHLLLEGAIETHDWGVGTAVAIGNVLSAAFLLWAFQRTFLAQRRETVIRPVKTRVTLSEAALTGILCAVLLGVGFYSEPWLETVDKSVSLLAERFEARHR